MAENVALATPSTVEEQESAIRESLAEEWSYIAEGGANLVVAYSGPSHVLQGQSLRLRKKKVDAASDTRLEDPAVRFGQVVVAPLLGSKHVPRMDAVRVPTSLLLQLQQSMTSQRPIHRQVVDELDVMAQRGVLVTNLVNSHGGDTISIEIKPKWSFMHSSVDGRQSETRLLKQEYCRTCAIRLTRDNGAAGDQRYCPIQLFSGDDGAVRSALDCLIAIWQSEAGAGNSFRVFKNGCQMKHLEFQFNEDMINLLATLLANSQGLARLAQLQHLLDPIDIEGIQDAMLDDQEELSAHTQSPFTFEELYQIGQTASSQPSTLFTIRQRIGMYLLSMSFKDCSMLMTYSGGAWQSIKFIDCDVKGIERWSRYVETDQLLWSNFTKLIKAVEMTNCSELLQKAKSRESIVIADK